MTRTHFSLQLESIAQGCISLLLEGDLLEEQAAKFTESWNLLEAQNVNLLWPSRASSNWSEQKGTLRLSAAVKWVHDTLTKRGGIHSTCPDMSRYVLLPPALYLLSCGSLFGEDRSGRSGCPWRRWAARLETWKWEMDSDGLLVDEVRRSETQWHRTTWKWMTMDGHDETCDKADNDGKRISKHSDCALASHYMFVALNRFARLPAPINSSEGLEFRSSPAQCGCREMGRYTSSHSQPRPAGDVSTFDGLVNETLLWPKKPTSCSKCSMHQAYEIMGMRPDSDKGSARQ